MPVGQRTTKKKSFLLSTVYRHRPTGPVKETVDFIFAFYYSLIPIGAGGPNRVPVSRQGNQLFRG